MDTKRRLIPPEARQEIVLRIKDCLRPRREISFAYIHGSFVSPKPFRDVDIAVYLEPDISSNYYLDYETLLEDAIQQQIGTPVDVRVINDAPLSFCYSVIKNGRLLLARNPDLRYDFEARTLDMYFDFAPFRSRYVAEVLGLEV